MKTLLNIRINVIALLAVVTFILAVSEADSAAVFIVSKALAVLLAVVIYRLYNRWSDDFNNIEE